MIRHYNLLTVCLIITLGMTGIVLADDSAELAALRAENELLKIQIRQLQGDLQQLRAKYESAATNEQQAQAQVLKLEQDKQRLTKLAGITPAGDVVASHEAFMQTSYDPELQLTTVRSRIGKLYEITGVRGDHWFRLQYQFPGETQSGDVSTAQVVITTWATNSLYRSHKQATFTIDGESRTYAVSHYNSRTRYTGSNNSRTRIDDETVVIDVPVSDLQFIGNAGSVKVNLGRAQINLSRDQITAFEAIRSRIELTAK